MFQHHKIVSKLIQKSSSQVNQDATVNQKITVDCGSKPFLKRRIMKIKRRSKDTWWGKIKGLDVLRMVVVMMLSQSGQVKLAAINSDVLKDRAKNV